MEPLRALFDGFAGHLACEAAPVGDGHPVIVYPGLGAGAMHTSALRSFLKESGFTFKNPNATGGCGCGSPFSA